MTHDQRFTGEYLEIADEDFDEWVVDASTNCLLDALYEYLTVMEGEAKLAGKDGDFTDPDVLVELTGIIGNLCVYGPRISDVRAELYRRHAPVGHTAGYRKRFTDTLESNHHSFNKRCSEPVHTLPKIDQKRPKKIRPKAVTTLKSGLPQRIRRNADPQQAAIDCALTRHRQLGSRTPPVITINTLQDLIFQLSDDDLIELVLQVYKRCIDVAIGVDAAIAHERKLIDELRRRTTETPPPMSSGKYDD
jgi:hypothetical protein